MKRIVNIKVAAIQLINHTNVGKKMFEFKSYPSLLYHIMYSQLILNYIGINESLN